MKKPIAILCSDLHLRDSVPICRTDDYWKAQETKIKFISDLQKEYNCPVLCAGDLFHKAKSSPFLEAWTIKNLSNKFYSIVGQHDLPNHNLNDIDKSSFEVLFSAKKIEYLPEFNGTKNNYSLVGFNFGEDIKPVEFSSDNKKIVLIHTFVQKPNDEQDKIIGGYSANNLMKKLKDFDLIITGDNHKTFVAEKDDQILVNPGSMMRMTTAQIDHKPCVFLYYNDNTIEQIFLPVEGNVISNDHIKKEKDKSDRIESFINRMNDNYEIGLSFEKNLETFFIKNKIRKPVQEIIWEVIEEQ